MIPLLLIIIGIAGFFIGGTVQFLFLTPADPLGNLFRIIYGVLTIMGGMGLFVVLITLWSFKRYRAKLLMKPYHVEYVNYPNELYRVEILGSPTTFTFLTKTYGIGALLHGKYGFHNWDDFVPIDLTLDMPWGIAKVFSADEAHDLIEDQTLINVERARRRISISGSLLGIGIIIAIVVGIADLGLSYGLRDLMIQGFNILIEGLDLVPPPVGVGEAPDLGGSP